MKSPIVGQGHTRHSRKSLASLSVSSMPSQGQSRSSMHGDAIPARGSLSQRSTLGCMPPLRDSLIPPQGNDSPSPAARDSLRRQSTLGKMPPTPPQRYSYNNDGAARSLSGRRLSQLPSLKSMDSRRSQGDGGSSTTRANSIGNSSALAQNFNGGYGSISSGAEQVVSPNTAARMTGFGYYGKGQDAMSKKRIDSVKERRDRKVRKQEKKKSWFHCLWCRRRTPKNDVAKFNQRQTVVPAYYDGNNSRV